MTCHFLQAGWRSWVSREMSKQECREHWKKDFGQRGEHILKVTKDWGLFCGSVGGQSSARGDHGLADCVRRLCYFVQPVQWEDVQCLANVIGVCFVKDRYVSNGIPGLLVWATRDLGARMVLVRNLFQISIACIAAQRDRFKGILCMTIKEFEFKFARNKGVDFESPSDDDDGSLVVGRTLGQLIDLVLGLVSFQGKELGVGCELLAQVRKELFTAKWIPERRRVGTIFTHISEILSCCNESLAGGYSRESPAAAESLATSCIVSYISCYGTPNCFFRDS